MPELDDDALLDALGVEVKAKEVQEYSPQEERIIAGFDEILRWYERHRRHPRNTPSGDIFERLYAVRLARLRSLPDAVTLLSPRDPGGLLTIEEAEETELDDDALLAELGVAIDDDPDDIRTLRHVEPYEQRKAAEEVATRKACPDFGEFQPIFERIERELRSGTRHTVRLTTRKFDAIQHGSLFIVGGQLCYIADVSEPFLNEYERQDSRLRVIYDNGTESDLLQRSFQRALHRDELARIVTEPTLGPLFEPLRISEPVFGDLLADGDVVSGTIYVLRSDSSHPFVIEHREVVHKIGVTTGKVSTRVANSAKDPTYLLAGVEVVAQYALANINPTKLENLFHRLFGAAQINLTIKDRFGHPVKPREWFLVPLDVIDEAVSRVKDGSITDFEYSMSQAKLVRRP